MADCGATGSALDRVARAAVSSVAGGGNGSSATAAAAKNVASFLGQAATVTSSTTKSGQNNTMTAATMPLAPPTHLELESSVVQQQNTSAAAMMPPGTARTTVGMRRPQQQQQQQATYAPHSAMMQQQQQQQQQQFMMQQHQQQQFMMQQQQHHQQQAMMQQQHQMMQQQMQSLQHLNASMKQQKQQKQQKSEPPMESQVQQKQHADAVASNNIENWHEGLEHEIQEEIAAAASKIEEATTTAGHEGVVHGATMEELAHAWAEAEAMYNQENSDLHEYSSLYEPGSVEEQDVRSYQFSDAALETTKPIEPQDYMAKGMKSFDAGQMQDAIMNFELELRHNDGDNPVAWRMLGRAHAENDEDRKAIACLENAVDRDPYSPEALLALGVSYVNELNHARALENLKAWITNNPKYAGMELTDDVYGSAVEADEAAVTATAFDDVQRLLLQALEYDSTDSTEIQEALGVVYNVSRDYEAAITSFRTAVERRPDDYQLWNKLGATLANSSQSEEALTSYERALQLKPRYARAWLNMAISHSNLQNYDDAARCYLQTLSLNPGAGHCWSYLRIALSCSERWDLIPSAASQDLEAFRQHFDFV